MDNLDRVLHDISSPVSSIFNLLDLLKTIRDEDNLKTQLQKELKDESEHLFYMVRFFQNLYCDEEAICLFIKDDIFYLFVILKSFLKNKNNTDLNIKINGLDLEQLNLNSRDKNSKISIEQLKIILDVKMYIKLCRSICFFIYVMYKKFTDLEIINLDLYTKNNYIAKINFITKYNSTSHQDIESRITINLNSLKSNSGNIFLNTDISREYNLENNIDFNENSKFIFQIIQK